MANKFCRNVTELPETYFVNVKVPAGSTLSAGQVIVAEKLDTSIPGNYTVYVPEQVKDITSENICVVLNGGFETMADGRRPDGNANYGSYNYQAGEIATAVRINVPNVRFEISIDSLKDGISPEVGGNLIPANNSDTLDFSAKGTAVTAKNYLKVEATKAFRIGGKYGSEFANSLVVRSAVLDA